jgi:hypothetical protein
MRESKFNFVTYRKDAKPIGDDFKPFVSVGLNALIFSQKTLQHYGLKDKFLIRLYEDEEKRTIGFVFCKPGDTVDKNTYLIKIKQRKFRQYTYDYARIPISSFLKRIHSEKKNFGFLPVEKYFDNLFGFNIYYVTIPKNKVGITNG